jgi:hypothetical protein
MYRTRCPLCGHRIKYPEDQAGKKCRCPHCGFPFRVPLNPTAATDDGPQSATGRDLASLTALNRQLTPVGVEHLSHFLDRAAGPNVARFSSWLGEANDHEISRAAEALNSAGPNDIDPLQDWWEPGPAGPARVVSCAGCRGAADPKDEFHFHGYKERKKYGREYRYIGLYHGSEHFCKRCIDTGRRRIVRLAVLVYAVLWVVLGALAVYGIVNARPACYIGAVVGALVSLLAIPRVRDQTKEVHVGQALAIDRNRQRLDKKGLWVVRPGRGPSV